MKFFIEYDSDTRRYDVYVKRWFLGRKTLIVGNYESDSGILGVKNYVVTPYLLGSTTYDFVSSVKDAKDQKWL